jgi:hypothetical protein
VHARATGLNAALVFGGDFFGHGKKFGMVNSYGRACARSRMCVRPCAREKWIVVR